MALHCIGDDILAISHSHHASNSPDTGSCITLYLTEQYSPVAWQQLEELGVDSRQYEEVWTLGSEEFCYAFNSQIDDALVQQFQQALDRVRQQADYPALLQQFGLSP